MDSNHQKNCRDWYERSYTKAGFAAQRLYPNEELCRFLGREYFNKTNKHERKDIRILEIGCGSCSNLWMIAQEGFDAYGIDISPKSIALGREMLRYWGGQAQLNVGSMCKLPYKAEYFNAVLDIFSAYCLCENDFHICLDEVTRILKPGGYFFSYMPSIESDAYKNHKSAEKIDRWTLSGIKRATSPYYGNNYPFRFISPKHYNDLLVKRNFRISYLETIGKTYQNRQEKFEWVVVVANKNIIIQTAA